MSQPVSCLCSADPHQACAFKNHTRPEALLRRHSIVAVLLLCHGSSPQCCQVKVSMQSIQPQAATRLHCRQYHIDWTEYPTLYTLKRHVPSDA